MLPWSYVNIRSVFSTRHNDNILFIISNVSFSTIYYFRMFVFRLPIELPTLAWRSSFEATVAIRTMEKYFKEWKTAVHIQREISRHVYYFTKTGSGFTNETVISTKFHLSPILAGRLEILLLFKYSCYEKIKKFAQTSYDYNFVGMVIEDNTDAEDEMTIDIHSFFIRRTCKLDPTLALLKIFMIFRRQESHNRTCQKTRPVLMLFFSTVTGLKYYTHLNLLLCLFLATLFLCSVGQ